MAISVTRSNRLQLVYDKGAFSFNRFSASTSNQDLHRLATLLNDAQDEKAKAIRRVRTLQIIK